MSKTFDSRCYALAEHFLADYSLSDINRQYAAIALAQDIQHRIEAALSNVGELIEYGKRQR